MTWKRNALVVANVTATSDELLSTLRERADREPMSFELIIPATPFGGGAEAASEQLRRPSRCSPTPVWRHGAVSATGTRSSL